MHEGLTTSLACFLVDQFFFFFQMAFLKMPVSMVIRSFFSLPGKNYMRNFNLHYHSSEWLCHACSTNIRGDHVLQ